MFYQFEKMASRSLSLLTAIVCLAGTSHAGMTDPTLYLTRAVSYPTPAGTLVRIEGEFAWSALLQSGYPIQLIIWSTTGSSEFVRLGLQGEAVVAGVNPVVEAGVTSAEALEFMAAGSPDSGRPLSHIGPGRLDAILTLPFASGPMAAQLMVIDEGTPFVSNVISISPVMP